MADTSLYGIWITGKGWLKGKSEITVSFDSFTVAEQTAKRFGNAKVYFIDKSLEDLENVLLEIEHRKTLSYKVKTLWQNIINSRK